MTRLNPVALGSFGQLSVKLNVSAPFHCKLMHPAAQKLRDYMIDLNQKTKFADPEVPIVSNVTALPVLRAGELLDLEVQQVTKAVQWMDSIRFLAYPASAIASSSIDEELLSKPVWEVQKEEERRWQRKGFDDFLELGPGSTLCGFVRQIGPELNATNVGTAKELIEYCKHYSE